MLKIHEHKIWGWYASFESCLDIYYFGTAGWGICMTCGNEYFKSLRELHHSLMKNALKETVK